MQKITLYPTAKINLGLYVLFKRDDHYHQIQTCMYRVKSWTDELHYWQADSFGLRLTGRPIPEDGKANLCERAFRMVQERYNIPNVQILLNKKLPIGGGLGGGSADAAFLLKSLSEQFVKPPLSDSQLKSMAAELGSDCSFFVDERPQIAEGRGEVLRPYPLVLPKGYLLILVPQIHISTREAYSGVGFSQPKRPLEDILAQPQTWKKELENGFEAHIFKKYPELSTLKQQLYKAGAWYASMSGSGACMYGFFEQKPDLEIFENLEYWLEEL